MTDDDLPPDPLRSPSHSGELTASARGRPRSVASLLNEYPDVDEAEIERLDDAEDGVITGFADRPFVASTFAPTSELAGNSDEDDDDLHRTDDGALSASERDFGDYDLLRRLAFGGMGEVFLARRKSDVGVDLGVGGLTRLIVVKRVLGHMRRDDRHRQMFLDEAALQKMLRSPHIVQIHDVGDHDGLVFLAMEHVHGPSWRGLVDRCRRRRQHIPVAFVAEMMIQACEALSYAHNLFDDDTGMPLRVVHRDINPHNVLVTYGGVVKVIDFGIAKSELRDGQTETGTIKGKFAYMSPEQSAAEPLDARSDLFALGICLYELLALANPFKRSNIVLSLEAIQKTTPKSIAEVRPGAAILAPIVERMLRKNPDDRFFDCSEVATALRALMVDGLLPEPKQTLSVWLRELYADDIAEHHRLLEATRQESPTLPTKTKMPPSTKTTTTTTASRATPTAPRTPAPAAASMTADTASGRALRAPRLPTPRAQLVALPALAAAPETVGTNPTAAVAALPRAVAIAPRHRSRAALIFIAGAAVAAAVAVGIAVGLMPKTSGADVDAGVVVSAFVDAGAAVLLPVVVDAGAVFVDAGIGDVDAGVLDGGVLDGIENADVGDDDKGDAAVEGVEVAVGGDVIDAGSVARLVHVVDDKPKVQRPKTVVVGKIAVGAEGFVVKGSRAVPADGATVLVVDNADAPFRLKLRIEGDANGGRLSLETTPWAVVRVDQVGQGRTPLQDLALASGRKTLISLQNPEGQKMDVFLTYTPSR